MNSFADFGLLTSLQKTLKANKLTKPTEVQSTAIPLLMSGQSVVGVSETGSGKTLAYVLPLLNMLKTLENEGQGVKKERAPRAVVMAPTRDLGEQISKVFKNFTHDTRLRVRPALGGMELEQARRNTAGDFEILLATPGRLIQMIEKKLIDLSDVRVLVFDEADQMMDQGFLPDTQKIAKVCPRGVQMALFSATISPPVQELINDVFANAEVVRTKGSGKVVTSLTTKNMDVEDGKRWPLFEKILTQRAEGGTIVFANTREQVDKIAKELADHGYHAAIYRGEMDKVERRLNLKKFRDGKVDLLVATDLAARGLDVDNVGRVINYHLPKQMENYLHRAGRTARAGRKGVVINLVTERDSRLIAALEGNKPAKAKNQPKPEEKPRETSKARFKANTKTVPQKPDVPRAAKSANAPSKGGLKKSAAGSKAGGKSFAATGGKPSQKRFNTPRPTAKSKPQKG